MRTQLLRGVERQGGSAEHTVHDLWEPPGSEGQRMLMTMMSGWAGSQAAW